MKTLQFFSLIIVFSIFLSCQNKPHVEENKEVTYIYIDSLSNENIISKNTVKSRFLKLETTNDCLIAYISKMDFDDNKIFIKDSNEKIFVFDQYGNYLNTIGQKGPGPDEHLLIYDFYLDKKNKRVGIIDIFKHVIYLYSYNGKLMEKKDVNWNIFKDFSRAYLVDENTLLLIKRNFIDSRYNFVLVSGENFDNAENFVPYLFIGEKYGQSEGLHTFIHSNNKSYVSAFISDTIYRYDANTKKIVPDMVFKGKYRPMTQKDVGGRYLEVGSDAFLTAREKKLSFGIRDLAMTKKYLIFTFEDVNNINRVFWNMETKKGNIFPYADESIVNNFFSYAITTIEDTFVRVISADDFISRDWSGNESAQKVLENTIEDDNPILVFFYLE